ncbi:MAG: DUF479 domain-containing protein [Flavobacterium sp.]|uniref:acyl carrier protein phosphodiesterase n=1 Tax=Flavobacterium sp. TaxID=239 RepID=UPI0012255705|nr:acyl carrier protein phosphodiesterase [Flavobacterium sp.]RZJ68221.1 MAG: DUF479 domain-containing protein [Flavobacterium sp.]
MNFLAHIYLSGDNDLIKIGNLMADGVRGKEYETMHPEIQKGILLHRGIDTFTDSHPIFRQSTKRLHEKYHHYAGVIVDIFYDHFLAKNFAAYSHVKLDIYVNAFYESLKQNYELLNDKTRDMMPYMIKHNWLWNYQFVDGIERILTQMDQRTRNDSKMRFSTAELKEFYADFENEFTTFFEDLRAFASQKLSEL